MTTPTAGALTLARIGQFIGSKIREIMDLMDGKADRSQVAVFHKAGNLNEMLNLNAKVNDFCMRSDTKTGFRLDSMPATVAANWSQVFAPATATTGMSVPFNLNQFPVITHNMSSVPSAVIIMDNAGDQHLAHWEPLDGNRIQISFAEQVAGTCTLFFF